jgi:hypothetical protein
VSGTSIAASGVISSAHDTDTFSFASGAGVISFTANVAQYGPTLDLKLTLLDANGKTIASADTATLGETLSASVPAGRYYLQVASHGNYGDVGQYTLSGAIVAAPQPAANPPAMLPPQDVSPSPAVIVSLPAGALSNVVDLHLSAQPHRKHAISLQWQTPTLKHKSLKIQRSTDGQHWITLAHLRPRATNWTDHRVTRGHSYFYRIVVQIGTQTEQTQSISAAAAS